MCEISACRSPIASHRAPFARLLEQLAALVPGPAARSALEEAAEKRRALGKARTAHQFVRRHRSFALRPFLAGSRGSCRAAFHKDVTQVGDT